MHDISFLCRVANITQQTFYRLVRTDSDFRTIVENGRTKLGNSYKYDDTVLEWLTNRYSIDITSANGSETAQNASADTESINALMAENEALRAEIEALRATLAEKESSHAAERKELESQTAQVLLLLQQEKQEKLALLPAPDKSGTFLDRLKNLFKKQ